MDQFFKKARGVELPAPPCAKSLGSREIARMWISDRSAGGTCEVILGDAIKDPFEWGIALVDLMGHVANMHGGGDPQAVAAARQRVLDGFMAELANPTDTPREIVDEDRYFR